MNFTGEKIFETTFWQVYLAENQTYLGYCIVSLKRRDCGDLADLTAEEVLDFLELTKKFEKGVRKAFGATMFNWSCLMNLAYQNTPPNPHLHWHVRPRYDRDVIVAGVTFVDALFGQHYEWPSAMRTVDASVREVIVAEINKAVD